MSVLGTCLSLSILTGQRAAEGWHRGTHTLGGGERQPEERLCLTWAMNLSTRILLVSWRARRPQRNSYSGGLLLGIFLYSRYLSERGNQPLPAAREASCCPSGSQVEPSCLEATARLLKGGCPGLQPSPCWGVGVGVASPDTDALKGLARQSYPAALWRDRGTRVGS